MAYELAEMLCSSAKRFAASLSGDGSGSGISAIDWHLEFGELKDTLDEIRADYLAADGSRLELRPYLVSAPQEVMDLEPIRQYRNFRRMINVLQKENDVFARGKLKGLREVLKRGETETEYYLRFYRMKEKLSDVYQGIYAQPEYDRIGTGKGQDVEIYADEKRDDEIIRRSLLFDAIEISDTFIGFSDEEVQA